jgi:hypothetical protein
MSDNQVMARRARRMIDRYFDEVCPVRDDVIDPDLDEEVIGCGRISDERIVRDKVYEDADVRVICPINNI